MRKSEGILWKIKIETWFFPFIFFIHHHFMIYFEHFHTTLSRTYLCFFKHHTHSAPVAVGRLSGDRGRRVELRFEKQHTIASNKLGWECFVPDGRQRIRPTARFSSVTNRATIGDNGDCEQEENESWKTTQLALRSQLVPSTSSTRVRPSCIFAVSL